MTNSGAPGSATPAKISVKCYLTERQGLRLLCIGGRGNLCTVRSIQ